MENSLVRDLDKVQLLLKTSRVRVAEVSDNEHNFYLSEFLFLDSKILLSARVRQFHGRTLEGVGAISFKTELNVWVAASEYEPVADHSPWATALSTIVSVPVNAFYVRHTARDFKALALSLVFEHSAVFLEILARDLNASAEQIASELESAIYIQAIDVDQHRECC